MATLKTNTLTGTSTAGSIAVTGEGNSTTTNLQQGLCKAFAFVDHLTDNGTGDYSITFTNNMANNDYYYGTTQRANSFTAGVATESDLETSKIDNTLTYDATGSNVDRDIQGGCVAGDLA